MIKTRRLALDVRYNSYPFSGQVGGDIESLTYTDSAADNSDSIDITINAQDRKWLLGWMPEKGATLRARILGYNWERQGQRSIMECGLFVLDDVSFSDAPTTLQVGGVSKPSDSDFSELERDVIWKNTSIKRIGAKIAARYGLAFTYDADDYDIECDEQDGTDSSYYNGLCKNYGLILKVYARRLWVYDREKYKAKRAVRTFDRSQIRPGSFGYTTTLSGTYTGGYFNYTDADKDIDIECSVGGGSHTKSVNRRATSVYDASVQLCAELNSANHGTVKLRFGGWRLARGKLSPRCEELNLNGKYFVDKVTHKVSKSGLTTDFECSGIGPAFHSWDVGGKIVYHEKTADSGVSYDSTYATTSPAAGAASAAAGGEAGQAITLNKAPLYVSSTAKNKAGTKTGAHLLAVRRHPDQRALPRDQQRGAVRQAARRPERDGLGACEILHRQQGGEKVMAGTNRTGRVSAIDYKAGTYEVTYFDRGKSVTRQINAISNGEYKMPSIGQVVSVSHNSSCGGNHHRNGVEQDQHPGGGLQGPVPNGVRRAKGTGL